MQQAHQLDDNTVKNSSKFLWLGLQGSTLFLAGCLFILNNVVKLEPIVPEFKNIMIGLCLISIPATFFLIGRMRQSERDIRENIHSGIENSHAVLQRYITWLVIGMALAELPAIFALAMYMLTGEMMISLFFIFVSFIIGFFYKPAL